MTEGVHIILAHMTGTVCGVSCSASAELLTCDLVWIPYSGKFSLGANFRDFRRLATAKIKTEKINPGRPENLYAIVMQVHAYYSVKVWILCEGDRYLQTVDPLPSPRGPLSIRMRPASTVRSHLSELQLSEHVGYPNAFSKATPSISGYFCQSEWPISSVSGLALPVVESGNASHPVTDGPSSVLIVISRTILFVESSFFALNIL